MITKAAILPGIISILYVGISTLILYKGIIFAEYDSIFYDLYHSDYNIFEAGYFLGHVLAYAGGPNFIIMGQLMTLGLTFVMADAFIAIVTRVIDRKV